MNRLPLVLALVTALGAAACSESPTIPAPPPAQAGTLTLSLTTPNADDGAVAFEVTGAPMDSLLAGDASLQLFTRRVGDTTIVAAVVGDLAAGVVVRIQVPDVSAAARYSARVTDVADRQDELRSSLTGYALTVVP